MKLRLGQWVRVKPGCGWIGEPKGRVTEVFPSADQYLVTFHQPAQDGDGDGPYLAACLRARDLQKITSQGRKKAVVARMAGQNADFPSLAAPRVGGSPKTWVSLTTQTPPFRMVREGPLEG